MMNNDDSLLNEIINGSVPAYEQLFKKYYKLLYTSALYILKNEMDAEDQVQQLFIEFWHKQIYHNVNSSLKAYLQKAIHNRCLKVIEKRKLNGKRLKEYSLFHRHELYEDDNKNNEAEKEIFGSLKKLPLQRLQAFNLVYLENKKYKEAADEMGITVNSIKTHLKLAIKTLRQKFLQSE